MPNLLTRVVSATVESVRVNDHVELVPEQLTPRPVLPDMISVGRAETLAPGPVDLEAVPPEEIALLIVQRQGPEEFTLEGMCGRHVLPATRCPRPGLSLGELARADGESPADIHYLLRSWSRNVEALGNWIRRVREDHQDDDIRLIIWDSTGFEIPWELFHLPHYAGSITGDWLGAVFPVARRVSIFGGPEGWDPWAAGHTCAGEILASVDAEMAADINAFDGWASSQVEQHRLLDSLDSFERRLGLVYIACHGMHDPDNALRLRLGSLRLRDIDDRNLHALKFSHSMVFLNACHSGALTWSKPQNNGAFGFAEVFLRKGAAAVIGVSGRVETVRATEIAQELISTLGASEGTPIAVALRNARRAVTARIDDATASDDDLKKLLYTFMYVLWGSPYASLSLERAV